MCRTIIAGSRSFPNEDRARTRAEERSQQGVTRRAFFAALENAQHSGLVITQVVSGGARGIDRLGEEWGSLHKIPVRQFIPDWEGILGKRAGFARNREMTEYAHAAVLFWDGASSGTRNTLEESTRRGLALFLYIFDGERLCRDNAPWRHTQ